MMLSSGGQGRGVNHFSEMMSAVTSMRLSGNDNAVGKGPNAKSFDESLIEPIDNSPSYQSQLKGAGNPGANKRRGGQLRASDGKFESGYNMGGPRKANSIVS